MKLSELSTEKAMDVLCELAPFATKLLGDSELLDELKAAVDFSKAETLAEKTALVGEKISKIIPIFLRKHKNDVFGMIAVLNETSFEKIAGQNIVKTMHQIKDIVKDKELIDFFKFCTDSEGSE